MGQHADDALEETLETEFLRMKHRAGEMDDEEAYECGICDEEGFVSTEKPFSERTFNQLFYEIFK